MDQRISDEQVGRMVAAIDKLASGGNAAAIGIKKALGRRGADQRGLLCGFYVTLYEVMLSMGMAMDSKRSVEDVKAALDLQPAKLSFWAELARIGKGR